MSELKRTQLYDVHVSAGATMVDFGGWEMPIQYPSGIIAEHLYTRQVCGLFDVSHMGRLLIEGPQRKEFLQHVLTSNVSALDLNMAQYCIIPNENGGAVDDAYLYLFQEDSYLLVVNAANIDKDLEHNRLIVCQGGDDSHLFTNVLHASQMTFIAGEAPAQSFECTAKVRYRQPDQRCRVEMQGDNATVTFENPQRAVTPGQSVVLYQGEECLGGGIIETSEMA